MSTYLVAWAVGEFKEKVPKYKANIPYRIITRPSEIEGATKASYYGPKVLEWFEEYFRVSFPLPKMDMLATPDFSAGAMVSELRYIEFYSIF